VAEFRDKTPPTGTPLSVVPTIRSVDALLHGVAGQLKGARDDIDGTRELLETVAADVQAIKLALVVQPNVLRVSSLPSPGSLMPDSGEPVRRPSMAVKAVKGAGVLGKWSAIVLGGLTLLGQIAAQTSPQYQGPVTAIVELAKSWVKDDAP
jgi:hypothetical protein